jgi:hypothetical protein
MSTTNNTVYTLADKIIPVSEDYVIKADCTQDPFVVLIFGGTEAHASFNFKHPKVLNTWASNFPFKHYRKNGTKFWTNQAGRQFAMVFRRTDVKVIPGELYSYVHCTINGEKITLNTSGGTDNGKWADWVSASPGVCLNLTVAKLKKIAELAVTEFTTNEAIEQVRAKQDDPSALAYLDRNNIIDKYGKEKSVVIKANGNQAYEVQSYLRRGFKVKKLQTGTVYYLPFKDVDWKAFYDDYMAPAYKQAEVA